MQVFHRRPSVCIFCTFSQLQPRRARSTQNAKIGLSRSPLGRKHGGAHGRVQNSRSSSRIKLPEPKDTRKWTRGRESPSPAEAQEVILSRLAKLGEDVPNAYLWKSQDLSEEAVKRAFINFRKNMESQIHSRSGEFRTLFGMFIENGEQTLDTQLRHAFYSHVLGRNFTAQDIKTQQALADLRFPAEWYPRTREYQRTIHLHVGPTNSGKTYHALKRLEAAETGCYAGPLRLLAHEVYTRLNNSGKPCALVTGEEQRAPEGQPKDWKMTSCTVEMVPLSTELDVAVVDEIQMLGSKERGWAWTGAVLGLRARELHLCGEMRAVPLVKELAAICGDKLEVHTYERLTPLRMEGRSLKGDLTKLRKGDCLISFSVLGIHSLRNQIQKMTGRKVAVVYGSLPPETRAAQARLFNDPDNDYDFLVASDAVGMGLNLSIKRVIFESIAKSNGHILRTLPISDIRQIAGRAGRYRTATQAKELFPAPPAACVPDNVGLVTTLEGRDYHIVRKALETEPAPLESAGIFPPANVVQRFSSYFPPGTPFSYIIQRLHDIALMSPRFHLCSLRDQLLIADAIHPVKNLTVADRILLTAAPANARNPAMKVLMHELASCIAKQKGGGLLEIENLKLEVLDNPPQGDREALKKLETLHKGIVLYLWLSFRFPGVFTSRPLAMHTKNLVEQAIETTLDQLSLTYAKLRLMRQELRKRMSSLSQQQLGAEADELGPELADDEGEYPGVDLEDDGLFVDEPRIEAAGIGETGETGKSMETVDTGDTGGPNDAQTAEGTDEGTDEGHQREHPVPRF
ncbi:hypothetical protein EJ06DRAFT_559850 [Trichodelitschia bisporula]|uniref:RNA helicase n=1 Tax=Trichodelitschia bisporula TaxID=703511 RepID=A0A6G1HL75_9PEZI|nr:hypothetical protein EJ06DRAFT_559850 [Trichodelitschia bisporula]